MSNIGPYSQSYNFTHMFNTTQEPIKNPIPGTLWDFIFYSPDFKKYRYMITIANLEYIFNDINNNITIFMVPDNLLKDQESFFVDITPFNAKNIIKASIIPYKCPKILLENNLFSYFFTLNQTNKLYISNLNNTILINDKIIIIDNELYTDNGIIHQINKMIIPEFII